ncbi:MAG: hypothetical protein N2234_00785 [Planctomycetota bacterium]|nr:hypothetical protein [Planctomycetota bacterium]
MEQHVVKRFWDFFRAFHQGSLLFDSFYGKMSGPKSQKEIVDFYKKADFSALVQVRNYFEEAVHTLSELSPFAKRVEALSSVESPMKMVLHRIFIALEHYQGIVGGEEASRQDMLEESDRLIRRYLDEVNSLLRQCSRGIEDIAKQMSNEKLFLRSLFLHGESVLGGAGAKQEMLRKIYEHGVVEFYFKVAYDFYKSGFYVEAKDALEKLHRSLSHHKAKKEDVERINKETEKLKHKIEEAIKRYLKE